MRKIISPQSKIKKFTRQSASGQGIYIKRKRICPFCKRGIVDIDHKNFELLHRFTTQFGRISSARRTKACAKHQRRITTAIKRARLLALLPFVN